MDRHRTFFFEKENCTHEDEKELLNITCCQYIVYNITTRNIKAFLNLNNSKTCSALKSCITKIIGFRVSISEKSFDSVRKQMKDTVRCVIIKDGKIIEGERFLGSDVIVDSKKFLDSPKSNIPTRCKIPETKDISEISKVTTLTENKVRSPSDQTVIVHNMEFSTWKQMETQAFLYLRESYRLREMAHELMKRAPSENHLKNILVKQAHLSTSERKASFSLIKEMLGVCGNLHTEIENRIKISVNE